MTAPREPDPTEPPPGPADERPRPLFSAGFWAAMAFTLLCILAGTALVKLGPTLWPQHPGPSAPPGASPQPGP